MLPPIAGFSADEFGSTRRRRLMRQRSLHPQGRIRSDVRAHPWSQWPCAWSHRRRTESEFRHLLRHSPLQASPHLHCPWTRSLDFHSQPPEGRVLKNVRIVGGLSRCQCQFFGCLFGFRVRNQSLHFGHSGREWPHDWSESVEPCTVYPESICDVDGERAHPRPIRCPFQPWFTQDLVTAFRGHTTRRGMSRGGYAEAYDPRVSGRVSLSQFDRRCADLSPNRNPPRDSELTLHTLGTASQHLCPSTSYSRSPPRNWPSP